MRLLFSMDKKNYDGCTYTTVRNSARGIILRDGKIAMIHSLKHGYYKLPGGGIEAGEDPIAAVIRETREEAGLIVKPETVREYGYVHRIQRGVKDENEIFIQDNYYYLCDVEDEILPPQMEDYEEAAGFTPEFVDARQAIRTNRESALDNRYHTMLTREAQVLELLIEEGVIP